MLMGWQDDGEGGKLVLFSPLLGKSFPLGVSSNGLGVPLLTDVELLNFFESYRCALEQVRGEDVPSPIELRERMFELGDDITTKHKE